jgi:NAD(P)-dependent dehydrogenase (short-subunit alcohol dehydrogenase family)
MASAKRKTILVTGCTRGLGRAMVEFFIGQGARVVGCGRSAEELKALEARFDRDHGFAETDVSDDADVADFARWALAEFGAPDLLINNAAAIAPNAPLWEVAPADVARVLDVNVRGTINVIRHFAPEMIARGSGVMVNFSSGWGRSTSPEVATYCASKWAIEGLTQALAQELPKGLAAVAVNPGIIDTAMLRVCFGEGAAHYPEPAEWVRQAGPFLLKLSAKDNGRSLNVPGIPVD